MATWTWIVVVIVVAVIVAALATMMARRRNTAALRQRFGDEYERTVAASDNPRAAEAELRSRQRERRRLDIKPLTETSRARYAGEWRAIQERFVDQPAEAANAADNLLYRVMEERGYPMLDFDAQSDLISVDHPDVVENYRVAHDIQTRAQAEQASTEDLREALLRYRSLFRELLGADDTDDTVSVAASRRSGATAPEDTARNVEADDDTR
jgi:hypothetical protein